MAGYVDPSIVPAGARQAEVLRMIVARGLRLERRGAALVLSGPGVFIAVANLASLAPIDTLPKSGEPAPKAESRTVSREFFSGKRALVRSNGR